jgi:PEGA domain
VFISLFSEVRAVSSIRRLVLLFAIGLMTLGFTRAGEAQWHGHVGVGVGGYYGRPYPYYYPYYASPFWYGYPWFGFSYPFGPYPYAYPYYSYESSIRLEVKPKEAEVYVDGYYAGIVDDFDGTFQRLHVLRGQHELTLYREGFKSIHQNVYLAAGSTFKVKTNLEPLAPGETPEPRPVPPPPPPDGQDANQPVPRNEGSRSLPPPPPPRSQGSSRGSDISVSGSLVIRVQPDNATVLIDGERWDGPRGEERLVVQVSEGTHRVEVQRDGYETFTTEVNVRRGETTPLNVSLRNR